MQQQVSLSCETKVIEPVGNNEFPRGVNGARKICDVRAPEYASWDVGDVEPAHNQTTLPKRNNEVVNLTGLLKTKD